MQGSLLIHYAQRSATPVGRVALFVESEPRLTWTSLFFNSFPQAKIYLVGGTVRDVLLGGLPNDLDLVIQGIPADQIERWLTTQGAVRFVGERFGTFKFTPHGCRNKEPIDIALPRTESVGPKHGSGRKDLMIQSDHRISILEDLSRRDFTINAIAYDLGSQELHDPFNGLSDLEEQIIRAVGSSEERFYEDATRILRALRFACQLRFGIEGETWEAIKTNLDLLNNKTISEDGTYSYVIPRDAIGKEFLLGFVAHPVHTLTLWDSCGALKQFIPWLFAQKYIVLENQVNAFDQTKQLLHTLERPSFLAHHKLEKIHPNVLIAGLSAFADDSDHALHLCRQLYLHQFPQNHPARVDCAIVAWLLDNVHALEIYDPASMRPCAFEKLFCSQKGKQLLCLIHAIELVSSKHIASTQRLHSALQLYSHYCENSYPKLISGSDIINMGVMPGVHFRDILDKIRDAQLVHKIETKEDAYDYLKNLI